MIVALTNELRVNLIATALSECYTKFAGLLDPPRRSSQHGGPGGKRRLSRREVNANWRGRKETLEIGYEQLTVREDTLW